MKKDRCWNYGKDGKDLDENSWKMTEIGEREIEKGEKNLNRIRG